MKHFARALALLILSLTTACVSIGGVPSSSNLSGVMSGSGSSPSSPPRMGSLPILTWGGDLAGSTMTSQTVAGIKGITVPTPTGSNTVLTYNLGAFSWGAGGGSGSVTWANDLAGSTSTNQYVAAISGSGGLGGTVPISASTLKETGSTLSVADSGAVVRDVLDMTHGRITAGGGGSDYKTVVGPLPSAETTDAALHLLANGGSAVKNSFALDLGTTCQGFASHAGSLCISAPGSGGVYGDIFFLNWNGAAAAPEALAYIDGASGQIVSYFGLRVGNPRTIAFDGNGVVDMTTGYSDNFQIRYAGTSNVLFSASAASNSTIQFDSHVTTANIGTGVDTATVNLQSGNGRTFFSSYANGAGTNVNAITGSLAYTTRTVTSSFTVDTTTTDNVIIVDTSGGPVTVTLPAPTNGRKLTIIDKKNSFATHNCTLATHAAEKINNFGGSYVLTTNGYRGYVISDGTDWYTED